MFIRIGQILFEVLLRINFFCATRWSRRASNHSPFSELFKTFNVLEAGQNITYEVNEEK